jgi:DNA repair exonuclease SbcCD ATPase subunit
MAVLREDVATLETELTEKKSESAKKLKEMNATLNHRLEQNLIEINDNGEMIEGLTNRVATLETELIMAKNEFAELKEADEHLANSFAYLKNKTYFECKDNCEMIKGFKIRVATLETQLTKEKSEHVKLKELLNHRLEQNLIDINDNDEMIEGLTNRVATLETELMMPIQVQADEVDLLYNTRVKVGYSYKF